MPSNRSEDECCRKKLVYFYFFLLSHLCQMPPLYPPSFLHPIFHTNMQVVCFMLTGILLLYHSLKSICFFAEFDPKTPMETTPLAARVDFLCVFFIFFLSCLITSLQEIKYPYLHPHLTYILNLAAICNSIPKNQFDVCGRSFLQTKKEGIQCYNLRIKDLICN